MSLKATIGIVFVYAGIALSQPKPLDQAWSLLAAGKREEAIRVLQQILTASPRDADAHLLLGSVLAEAGDRNSVGHLEQAVRLRAGSAEAHQALGEALNRFGEKKKARTEFEKAVQLDARFGQAQADLGTSLFEAGEFSAAAEHLDRAIQIMGSSPDAAYPHYLRAKIYTDQNQIPLAAETLTLALSARPDFGEAWSDLGQARKSLLDDAGASAAFERAVALSPDDNVAQARLGAEYLQQGKVREAIPHLEQAVKLNPENQGALYSLQSALRQNGQSGRAQEVKTKLSELLQRHDRAREDALRAVQLNNEGAQLEKAGDLSKAVEKYRAGLVLNPAHVGIRTNLAAALLRTGHWDEGIAELREASRRDPENDNLKSALRDAISKAPGGRDVSNLPKK